MRIACLQFDPKVGEVDNNLNRADAVLGKVHPDLLDGLDLLVLPELAFTGYNYKSLQHIAPSLEEAGCGISTLWAKTTALKHDCTVVVGYPEKVDVSARWPASPEYYNSAFVVNGDGDMVGNYRKSFLYYTDETWALEGSDGFFRGKMPGLGNVALGICTDINPYKLEAPWDAFEFGFHAVKAQANLVILTMAWQTHQDPEVFSYDPKEPDIETLVYWVQRLEPLVRADSEEEVIVVFCNRTGDEHGVTYTGTSAVIGIKRGEVFVYGVLGRGVNDVLIVDTDQPPMSKLTDSDTVEGDQCRVEQPTPSTGFNTEPTRGVDRRNAPKEDEPWEHHVPKVKPKLELESPRQPTSPRLPWLAQDVETPQDSKSPTRLQIPTNSLSPTRLQIPNRPQFGDYTGIDSAITDDIIIDTPAITNTPGFPRQPARPKQAIPSSPWRFPSKTSSNPWHHHDGSQSAVFGGGAAMTPITPFDEDGGWSSTPIDPKAPPPWYWRHEPTLSALKESIVEEEEEEEEETGGTQGTQPRRSTAGARESISSKKPLMSQRNDRQSTKEEDLAEEETEELPPSNDWADLAGVLEGLKEFKFRPGSAFDSKFSRGDRPGSPKSRNLSRTSSPFQLFQASELDYEEDDDNEEHYNNTRYGLARPSSRAGQRLVQRSSSFNVTSGQRHGGRQPSRLRHAISFREDDDEADTEEDYDSGPESPDEYSPRHVTRGRQPLPRETSVERQTAEAERKFQDIEWYHEAAQEPLTLHHTKDDNNNAEGTEPNRFLTTQLSREAGRGSPSLQLNIPLFLEETDAINTTKEVDSSPLTTTDINDTTGSTPSLCSAASAPSIASVVTLDNDSDDDNGDSYDDLRGYTTTTFDDGGGEEDNGKDEERLFFILGAPVC